MSLPCPARRHRRVAGRGTGTLEKHEGLLVVVLAQRTNVSGLEVQWAAAGEPLLFGLPVAVLKNDTREHQRIEVLPLSRPNLTGR